MYTFHVGLRLPDGRVIEDTNLLLDDAVTALKADPAWVLEIVFAKLVGNIIRAVAPTIATTEKDHPTDG